MQLRGVLFRYAAAFFFDFHKKHRLSRHRYTDQHKHLESNREGIDNTLQTVNICLKTLTQNINISNRAYLEFEKRQHKQYNIIGNIETAQPYSWTTEKEHYRPRKVVSREVGRHVLNVSTQKRKKKAIYFKS